MEFKASHQFSCLHGEVNGKTEDFRPAVARVPPGPAAGTLRTRRQIPYRPGPDHGRRRGGDPDVAFLVNCGIGMGRSEHLFRSFLHGVGLSESRVIGVKQRRLSRPRQGGQDHRMETWPVGEEGCGRGRRLPGLPGFKSSLQGVEARDRTTQEFTRGSSIGELARNGVALKQDLYGQLSSNLGIFHRDVSVRAHAGYLGQG